jgi:energy-coupling factor transport system permease protein
MRFLAPLAHRPDAVLARRNPVAKLAAALVLTCALLSTLDPLTPAIVLAVELAVVPLFGIGPAALARRAWPLLVGTAGVVLALLLFTGERTGETVLRLGPVRITTGVLTSELGIALRLLAVSLPGIVVLASTDPTDLGDALAQNARVPARFAIGALAAFRLLPLLGEEWELLRLARRARGLDAGRNPVAALGLFGSTMFGLLVGAIRRGTRLAVAMDARGFDSGRPRSVARVQRFRTGDAVLVAAGALLGTAALALSLALGTFRPLLG